MVQIKRDGQALQLATATVAMSSAVVGIALS